jgi:hypothetical protein
VCSETRLLAVMFATEDVCCVSQETLKVEGFGDTLPKVLRALLEARFVSRQAGTLRGAWGDRTPARACPPATVAVTLARRPAVRGSRRLVGRAARRQARLLAARLAFLAGCRGRCEFGLRPVPF